MLYQTATKKLIKIKIKKILKMKMMKKYKMIQIKKKMRRILTSKLSILHLKISRTSK